MFEKEAEDYASNVFNPVQEKFFITRGLVQGHIAVAFKDGAEFGYNKANEWHYVKDGIYPKDMENVIINAFDYGINTCYVAHRLNGKWRSNCSSEIFAFVIAWKEIVLPELKESE